MPHNLCGIKTDSLIDSASKLLRVTDSPSLQACFISYDPSWQAKENKSHETLNLELKWTWIVSHQACGRKKKKWQHIIVNNDFFVLIIEVFSCQSFKFSSAFHKNVRDHLMKLEMLEAINLNKKRLTTFSNSRSTCGTGVFLSNIPFESFQTTIN